MSSCSLRSCLAHLSPEATAELSAVSLHISLGTREGKFLRMLATLLPRTNWSEWNDATAVAEKKSKPQGTRQWRGVVVVKIQSEWVQIRSWFHCIYPDLASERNPAAVVPNTWRESCHLPDEARLFNCAEHSHTYNKYSYLLSHIL